MAGLCIIDGHQTFCKFDWDPKFCNYNFDEGKCHWCSVWLRTEEAWLEHLTRLEQIAKEAETKGLIVCCICNLEG